MRRELIAVSYDQSTQPASAGAATKQLIVLATDVLLADLSPGGRDPAVVAERLIDGGILPICFRRRYDRRFLEAFHNVTELTRNLLVGDLPFAACTAGELAVHAILNRARWILDESGRGARERAAAIDAGLPELLETRRAELREGLDWLEGVVIEDADIDYLFSVPADEEPDEHLRLPGATSDLALLAFENWLRPFGNAPRPQITYDGRAWLA